jgi:DNA-binding NarL/FixJ family response regulator
MRIKICLIEPQPIVRAGIRVLLETRTGFQIVAEGGEPATVDRLINEVDADIVLLEIEFETGFSGVKVIERITTSTSARVVVLTGTSDPYLCREAILRGARGLVLKSMTVERLYEAVVKVHAGEMWLEPELATNIIMMSPGRAKGAGSLVHLLTARERELVAFVEKGLSNKEISHSMCISESTVRNHLTQVFRKMGISSRLELIISRYERKPAEGSIAVRSEARGARGA